MSGCEPIEADIAADVVARQRDDAADVSLAHVERADIAERAEDRAAAGDDGHIHGAVAESDRGGGCRRGAADGHGRGDGRRSGERADVRARAEGRVEDA